MSRRVIVVMVAVIALSLVWIGIRTNVENLKTVDGYLVVKGGAE